MQFPVDHAFAWTSWVFMAEGLGTSVSVREGQNSGRARPAPEDGRLDSYGTDCSTPLKGTPGCEPQGRRKFGCATRPGRPRAVETRHRLAPPCCRPQRPGSGCRRRNRRLNTRSSVWEKQEEETLALPPAPSPGRTALASPRPLRGPPATGSWTFSCCAERRAVVRPRVLITRKAQAEGLFANVGAGESRVAVRPSRPWTGVSHPLASDRRVCPTRLAQQPRPTRLRRRLPDAGPRDGPVCRQRMLGPAAAAAAEGGSMPSRGSRCGFCSHQLKNGLHSPPRSLSAT